MKKIKEIYIITLVLIIIGVTTTFATAGTVNTNGVRMRKNATVDSEIITNLHNGDQVEILEKLGDWYKIKYKDKEGYMHSDFITSEGKVTDTSASEKESTKQEDNKKSEEVYPKTTKTKVKTKMYIAPSMSVAVVTEIKANKKITINVRLNNWSYISYGNENGWVRNYILEVKEEKKTENEKSNEATTPTITKGYVNVESANMRKEASTSSEVVTTLSINTKVTITEEKSGWYKVEYNSKKGYISKSLISSSATTTSRGNSDGRDGEVTPISKNGYVSAIVANIRQEASTDSKIITTLKQETKIEITGEKNGFYEIEIDGKTGYISKSIVVSSLSKIDKKEKTVSTAKKPDAKTEENKKKETTTNSSKKSGSDIVAFAKKYIGYRYVYGGTTPNGFDCSGFVYYVFNSCGYKISRGCSGQMSTGKGVSKSNLQPGDIIFFNNGGGGSIGHVGIYIGGGKIVHAANSRRGVTTDTINSGYYSQYYHSARRVI